MPRTTRSALGRITSSAAHRVPGANAVLAGGITITNITLSANTGTANSTAGTVIGTLTPVVTGGSLSNPVITLTSTAGGDFRVQSGALQFAVNNVPAGTYSVTAQVSADNATTYSKSLSVTINPAGAAFSWPIQFTGTAGTLPTGNATITPYPSSPTLASWSLDGNGALILAGNASYTGGTLEAPGYLGNGNFDITFASDTPNRVLDVAAFNNNGDGFTVLFRADGTVRFLAQPVAGGGGFLTDSGNVVPYNATSIGINFNGSVFTVRANGANTAASWTYSGAPGPWEMSIQNDTIFGAKITTINSTQASTVATTFVTSLSNTYGLVGDQETLTVTPVAGQWPTGRSLTVTQAVPGLLTVGSFSQPIAGTVTPVIIPVTVATTGGPSLTTVIDSGTSPMSSTGGDSYTAVVPATGGGTIRRASGMPTTGLAINPLAQGAIVYSGIVIAYACLHHNGADEARVAFGGGQTPPLTPADAAGGSDYTFRLYDAATGGNMFYESAPIAVAANPHLIGGDMSVTDWGGGISTSMSVGSFIGDGYTKFSSTLSDGSKYLSTVGNIPPDQPGGQTVNSKLHATDANPTVLYGGVTATQAGTMYFWVIATSAVSGKVSRWCYPSPIAVS